MANASIHTLTRAEIEERIDTLPTLPSVVTEVMGLNPASEEFHLRMRELALRDPPFAVRIIAVANSVSFAGVSPVLSVPEALMRLGARQVSQLIMSLSVTRVFIPSTEGRRNLWRHAIQVAVAARTIASHGPRGVEPQRAYLSGLLHDIGRFVMFEHDPVDLEAVEGTHWSTPEELLAAERKLCGFDHTELGDRACKVWAVPREIADIVRLHHVETAEPTIPQSQMAMIRVVQQADALSCLLIKDPKIATMVPSERQEIVERACVRPGSGSFPMTAGDLSAIVPPIAAESIDLTAALGIRSRFS